jgi:hypothetical protein
MAGEYSINDLQTTLLNSLADSERPPDSFLLFNFGEAQSIHYKSTHEIQSMAEFIASLGNRYNDRLAIASSYDLPYVLQRFVSVKSGSYGIDSEVFHSYDEAREWLVSDNFSTTLHPQCAQDNQGSLRGFY